MDFDEQKCQALLDREPRTTVNCEKKCFFLSFCFLIFLLLFTRTTGRGNSLCLRMDGVFLSFFLIELNYYGQTLEKYEQSQMFIT